jgi:sugar O-acyltransferase (sialic acid O-acetyltransferase NeuD family)
MKTLYLCGAGNVEGIRLAIVVNQAQKRWDRIAILDDDASKLGRKILGIEVIGPFSLLGQTDPRSAEAVNLVTRTTRGRHLASQKIRQYEVPFASLIHPGVDTTGVEFQGDITVYQNVSFCAGARVETGCVVLTGAVVGHGCHMARCCVVAPGAVINARVDLGEGVYLGTNASILPDLKVGAWATIGANSAVIQNVAPGTTVMGVPAQVLISLGSEEPLEGVMPQPTTSPSNGWQARPRADLAQTSPTAPRSAALAKLRQAQQQFIQSHRSN